MAKNLWPRINVITIITKYAIKWAAAEAIYEYIGMNTTLIKTVITAPIKVSTAPYIVLFVNL